MLKYYIGFFAVLLTIGVNAQINYYVDIGGSNTNNGSFANPWQNIQHGCDQLSAGDTLNIKAGTYQGKINIANSGVGGQNITIRNYQTDVVNINGVGLQAFEYLLKMEDIHHIDISGLHFRDYQELDAIGILVVNSSDILIEGNEFSNIDYASNALGQTPNDTQNSQPIIVYGRDPNVPISNIQIKNNLIHDCEVGYSECLSINGNVDGFVITGNEIYDNTNISIVAIGHEGECPDPIYDQARNGLIKNNLIHDNPSAYAAAAGIYIDGAKDMIVENNISYNNDFGIEVGCENNGNAPNDPSSSNIIVRNNLLYKNKITGIALGGYNYPVSGKVVNAEVSNNTCYANDATNSYNGEMLISYVENSSIKNNIFYAENSDHVLYASSNLNPTLLFDYNLYYSTSGVNDIVVYINGTEYYEYSTYLQSTVLDSNSIFADPMFEDVSFFDLHLKYGSPGINAGDTAKVIGIGEVDIDNQERIFNGRVDIGADEYGASIIQNKTNWTGLISSDWYNDGNWTAGVPNPTLETTIPNLMTRPMPIINAGQADCKNLRIQNGASLEINASGNLINH